MRQSAIVSPQGLLFGRADRIVNVASVPQRSPFRYPGGKTWLIPVVRRWFSSLEFRPTEFVEPFAGGASVGLMAGIENWADQVLLIELDEDVCSVWRSIFGGQANALANQIIAFRFTEPNIKKILASSPRSRLDRAFKTILRNRVLHGGILAPGASLMRDGENGKGLASRWYPQTLHRRITELGQHREKFVAIVGDGIETIRLKAREKNTVFFIDPPYTVAGKRLYSIHDIDHALLFQRCERIAGDFLMTYDDSPEIRSLARRHGFETATIPMKSRQHALKLELIVGKDLRWLKEDRDC